MKPPTLLGSPSIQAFGQATHRGNQPGAELLGFSRLFPVASRAQQRLVQPAPPRNR
jgi:hypothetical protein